MKAVSKATRFDQSIVIVMDAFTGAALSLGILMETQQPSMYPVVS
jgi:hypothetical protein